MGNRTGALIRGWARNPVLPFGCLLDRTPWSVVGGASGGDGFLFRDVPNLYPLAAMLVDGIRCSQSLLQRTRLGRIMKGSGIIDVGALGSINIVTQIGCPITFTLDVDSPSSALSSPKRWPTPSGVEL